MAWRGGLDGLMALLTGGLAATVRPARGVGRKAVQTPCPYSGAALTRYNVLKYATFDD